MVSFILSGFVRPTPHLIGLMILVLSDTYSMSPYVTILCVHFIVLKSKQDKSPIPGL